jgi:hypothetical protein
VATAAKTDDTHELLARATEAYNSVDASANAAMLEDDPASRKPLDHYRARYLEFARDSLLLAIARANSQQSNGVLDKEAQVEVVLCRATLDNVEAELERLPARR